MQATLELLLKIASNSEVILLFLHLTIFLCLQQHSIVIANTIVPYPLLIPSNGEKRDPDHVITHNQVLPSSLKKLLRDLCV